MRRKYFVKNALTGYICFNGRRFWTAKGAARKIQSSGFFGYTMTLHKIV
jgi:hypothetical protein